MRRPGSTLLVLVAVVVAGALGFMAWANSEFTECYALFSSESDAEAVVEELASRAGAPGPRRHMDPHPLQRLAADALADLAAGLVRAPSVPPNLAA